MNEEEVIEQLRMFERTGLWIRDELKKLWGTPRLFCSNRTMRQLQELCRRNTMNHLATVRFLRTHKIL